MGNNAFGSRKKNAAVGMGGIVAVINVVVVVVASDNPSVMFAWENTAKQRPSRVIVPCRSTKLQKKLG